MFDCHLHLQDPRYEGLRDAVLCRAAQAGVVMACTCSTSPRDWDATGLLESEASKGSPIRLLAAFGVHPWYAGDLPRDWLARLHHLLSLHPDAVIGEAGIDGLGKGPGPDLQREVLEAQLDLAAELRRPVVLHGARAWTALLDCCRPYAGKIPALLLHGFSGSAEQLREWSRLGAYFSFGGAICNPASTRLRTLPPLVAEDRLLVETDSPDMLPPGAMAAASGTRLNEPANLAQVVREVAMLRDAAPEGIARLTGTNACRFFRVDQTPPPGT